MLEAGVPQQGSNGNECGVFTMMCADFLSDNFTNDIQLARNELF